MTSPSGRTLTWLDLQLLRASHAPAAAASPAQAAAASPAQVFGSSIGHVADALVCLSKVVAY